MSLPPPPPPGSKRAYWTCQLAGWYGYGLVMVAAILASGSPAMSAKLSPEAIAGLPPWPRAAVEFFALCSIAIALSHGLHACIRRRRWDALPAKGLAWRVLVAGMLLGVVLGTPHQFLAIAALQEPSSLLQHSANWALLFWIWMTIYFLVLGSRKRRFAELRQSELTRALQGAELRLLKSQLNPHFLFNSLNSVRALISEDPESAKKAITQLARTLRYTLGSSQQDELATLEQELAIVDDYLALEALRLGERLNLERDVTADALRARVPVMLLQTVVENAVKHGIAELPEGGTLRIEARIADGELRLVVTNPRPLAAPPRGNGEGLGLRNGAERLRLLFGPQAALDLDLSQPGRAVARITIPVGR